MTRHRKWSVFVWAGVPLTPEALTKVEGLNHDVESRYRGGDREHTIELDFQYTTEQPSVAAAHAHGQIEALRELAAIGFEVGALVDLRIHAERVAP